MARIAKPWFRSERNAWYVCKDGTQQLLGEHPADAPLPRKVRGKWNAPPAIMQAFHELMAKTRAAPEPKAAGLTVAALFDKFLDWCEKHAAKRTFEDHKEHIQNFLDETPGLAAQAADQIKPFHVQEWVDRHPTWGDSYRRRRIISILRPYNWAAKLGYIDANPIRNVEKPACKRREEASRRSSGRRSATATRTATPSATCSSSAGRPAAGRSRPGPSSRGTSSSTACASSSRQRRRRARSAGASSA